MTADRVIVHFYDRNSVTEDNINNKNGSKDSVAHLSTQ